MSQLDSSNVSSSRRGKHFNSKVVETSRKTQTTPSCSPDTVDVVFSQPSGTSKRKNWTDQEIGVVDKLIMAGFGPKDMVPYLEDRTYDMVKSFRLRRIKKLKNEGINIPSLKKNPRIPEDLFNPIVEPPGPDVDWIDDLIPSSFEEMVEACNQIKEKGLIPGDKVKNSVWTDAIAFFEGYEERFLHWCNGEKLSDAEWKKFENEILVLLENVHASLVVSSRPVTPSEDPKIRGWSQEIVDYKEMQFTCRRIRAKMRNLKHHENIFLSNSVKNWLIKVDLSRAVDDLEKHPHNSVWKRVYDQVGKRLKKFKKLKNKAARRIKRSVASVKRKKNLYLWHKQRSKFFKSLKNKDQKPIDEAVFHKAVEYYREENTTRNKPEFSVKSAPKSLKEVLLFPESSFKSADWHVDVDDLKSFFQRCKKNSAPGWDGIQFKVWKELTSLHKTLVCIFEIILTNAKIPKFWQMAKSVLIPKAKVPTEGKHVRPINLQCNLYKLISSILSKKICNFTRNKGWWSDEQRGFISENGTMLNLFLLQFAKDNARRNGRRNKKLYSLFVDIQNAFGAVEYKQLIYVLYGIGIPRHICDLIWNCLKGGIMTFSFGKDKEFVNQSRGVKQGDPMSPIIFNLLLEPLFRIFRRENVGYDTRGVCTKIPTLGFADDLCILESKKDRLNRAIELMTEYLDWLSFKLVPYKCALMKMEFSDSGMEIFSDDSVLIGGTPVEIVTMNDPIRYLGGLFDNRCHTYTSVCKLKSDIEKDLNLLSEVELPVSLKIVAINQWIGGKLPYIFQNCEIKIEDLKDIQTLIYSAVRAWLFLPNIASLDILTLSHKDHGLGLIDVKTMYYSLITKKAKYLMHGIFDSTAREIVDYSLRDSMKARGIDYNFIGMPGVPKDNVKSFWSLAHSTALKFDMTFDSLSSSKVKRLRLESKLRKFDSFSLQGEILRSWREIKCCNYKIIRNWYTGDHYFKFWVKAFLQCLYTKAFKSYTGGNGSKFCDRCGEIETQNHVLNSCTFRSDSYIIRHDKVQDVILKHRKPRDGDIFIVDKIIPNYHYVGSVKHNKPDIMIINQERKHIQIIEIAVPYDRNILESYQRKMGKYKPLVEAIKKKYISYRVDLHAVVIGALGGFNSQLGQTLFNIGVDSVNSTLNDLFNAAVTGSQWVWKRRYSVTDD